MKIIEKILTIFLNILFIPLYLLAGIYILIELSIIKNSAYVRKNKIKLKGFYYFGIWHSPNFLIKNVIYKYQMNYEIMDLKNDIFDELLCLLMNGKPYLIYLPIKGVYIKDNKYYFQPLGDKEESYNLDEIFEINKINSLGDIDKLRILINNKYLDYEMKKKMNKDQFYQVFKNDIVNIKKILLEVVNK